MGSTSLTTDSSGIPVSEARYLPYGQERWTGGETPTDFGFTSQRNERGFGLHDYNARYYSAVLGRFVSPDTIVPEPGSSGGFNRYAYVNSNPLKYTDPSGHCSVDLGGGNSAVMRRDCINLGGGGAGPIIIAVAATVGAVTLAVEAGKVAGEMIYPQGEPVQPPTTSGGFEGEVQPPFTEGFSLNGPADDGVLPNIPPEVGPTHSPGFSLEEPGAFGNGVVFTKWTNRAQAENHYDQHGKGVAKALGLDPDTYDVDDYIADSQAFADNPSAIRLPAKRNRTAVITPVTNPEGVIKLMTAIVDKRDYITTFQARKNFPGYEKDD